MGAFWEKGDFSGPSGSERFHPKSRHFLRDWDFVLDPNGHGIPDRADRIGMEGLIGDR
jgi:hypothetical protein